MEDALIGLAGLLIGILLNEYYRRSSRIEKYSNQVFEKRLEVYEGLMSEVKQAADIISDLVENPKIAVEQKKEIAFHAGLAVATYTDRHQFYLNEEISVHCTMVFIRTPDIFEETTNEQELKLFRMSTKETYEMIRSEAGIVELDSLFRSITKSSPGGALIEYYRKAKKAHARKA
jgi:hypothetical protein